jgi:hypothetical protein
MDEKGSLRGGNHIGNCSIGRFRLYLRTRPGKHVLH